VTLILITLHTTASKKEEREQAVYLGENKECNCYKRIYYCDNIQHLIITVKTNDRKIKKKELVMGPVHAQ
jgi:hypothetical protein